MSENFEQYIFSHLVGTNSPKNILPGAINSTAAMIAAVIGHLLVNFESHLRQTFENSL